MTLSQWDIAADISYSAAARQAHSGLASPITFSGTDCLKLTNTADRSDGIYYAAAIKSSVESSKFFGIPNTKTLSMRALLRRSAHASSRGAIGLFCKVTSYGSTRLLRAATANSYYVLLGDVDGTMAGAPATHGVYLGLRKASLFADPEGPSYPDPSADDVLVYAHPADEWVRVRMDITPTGSASDLIEIYIGSGTGLLTWGSPVYSTTLTNVDGSYYVPWDGEAGDRRCGFVWNTNDIGCPVSSGAAGAVLAYIDDFNAVVEDV